jgi:transposase-like protein
LCDRWSYRVLRSGEMPKVAEVTCIYCEGNHVHKVTARVRVGGEKVKRYQCQDCGRYFQENYAGWKGTTGSGTYTVVNV